jgi:hypothetical protein
MLKMAGLNLSSEDRAGGAKAEENKRVKKQQEMEGLLKGDPNKIHELEHDKEHQEDLIKEKEAEKEEADRKVRDYKDQGANKPGHQDHQNYLNAVRDRKDKESEVTELKSGVKRDTSGNITSVTGEAGRTIAEKEYKRKNPGATDADAKAAVDPIFTQGKSLKDIDNEIKFEQKGRIKDYYHNLEQRGKNGGNIDMQTFRANFNREIRQTLGRSFNGALAGAVVGSVVPGIGTAIGAAIGGTGGAIASAGAGILSGIKEGLGQFTGTMGRRLTNNIFERSGTLRVNLDTNITGYAAMEKEAALAGNHDNKIKEFKSKYKSPGKDFFSMLGGLTGGGGGDHGGGGHDDGHGGGGGHDDGHGGGGHH